MHPSFKRILTQFFFLNPVVQSCLCYLLSLRYNQIDLIQPFILKSVLNESGLALAKFVFQALLSLPK